MTLAVYPPSVNSDSSPCFHCLLYPSYCSSCCFSHVGYPVSLCGVDTSSVHRRSFGLIRKQDILCPSCRDLFGGAA